jgi:hypothetical protein
MESGRWNFWRRGLEVNCDGLDSFIQPTDHFGLAGDRDDSGAGVKKCEGLYGVVCNRDADVYAMGRYANDWGGHYCLDHVPTGFVITDQMKEKK